MCFLLIRILKIPHKKLLYEEGSCQTWKWVDRCGVGGKYPDHFELLYSHTKLYSHWEYYSSNNIPTWNIIIQNNILTGNIMHNSKIHLDRWVGERNAIFLLNKAEHSQSWNIEGIFSFHVHLYFMVTYISWPFIDPGVYFWHIFKSLQCCHFENYSL